MIPNKCGRFILIHDVHGCRHLVSIDAIQWMHDTDCFQNESLLLAAERTIHTPIRLEQLCELVLNAALSAVADATHPTLGPDKNRLPSPTRSGTRLPPTDPIHS
jgi:hypothetical protein